MDIYKITNIKNNKIYIGQSLDYKERFKRHIQDSKRLDTHLARAIRKWGADAFIVDLIDTASTVKEAVEKEHNYIVSLNTTNTTLGYNETDSVFKCGGNTYMSKTEAEMNIIKDKIRSTKIGGKNPNAESVILIDILFGYYLTFTSQQECSDYLGLSSHMPVSRSCRKDSKRGNILFNHYFIDYLYKDV